jgi:MraZ protein
MDHFVSTYTNRIDAKGRVSVPAPFRTILAKDGFAGVFCYPALDSAALDAGGNRLVETIHGLLDNLDPYSDERDHLATALFGVSEILKLDADGRVILSDRLKAHTGISDQATFVGLGDKFQVWEPKRFEAQAATGRERLRELKQLLGAARRGSAGSDGARE